MENKQRNETQIITYLFMRFIFFAKHKQFQQLKPATELAISFCH